MIKRTERGWAGHFILGYRCRFHLNTLLECGDKKIIVSTVGNLLDRKSKEPEIISCNRYYETMAFKAKQDEEYEEYMEIDVTKQLNFKSQWRISEPFKDNEANEMHEKVVQEFIKKMSKAKK
jgi:hypothetical protein